VTVKELREVLEKYPEEAFVRFFTDRGSRELHYIKLIQDEVLYRHVVIIEVD
jgi:hypothetical protein